MYRLCIHPTIQQLARDEVKAVLADAVPCTSKDPKIRSMAILDERGWPTYNAIQSMKYLDAFCMEVNTDPEVMIALICGL